MSKKNKWKKHGKPKQVKTSKKSQKLELWRQRLTSSDTAWAPLVVKMDHREKLYNGEEKLKKMIDGDKPDDQTPHVRNIIFENIESKVSSTIPQPKVTAVWEEDEFHAEIIENWLRNELNRLPFEQHNDMGERTVPIQGGVLWMIEWDNRKRTHKTVGALDVGIVHPKQLAPQPGVYTGIEDMDWVIIKIPTTKATVKRQYGIDVYTESESEPEIRGVEHADNNDEALTQYVGFERNEQGGIDRYSWVNETELEDYENYQARHQPVCRNCGRVRPLMGQLLSNNVQMPDTDGAQQQNALLRQQLAGRQLALKLAAQSLGISEEEYSFLMGAQPGKVAEPERKYEGGPCPWCGTDDWQQQEMEYEQVIVPIRTAAGHMIPGEHPDFNEEGEPTFLPTLVPYYKPDVFPLVLQRSVSIYGQLLGNSDVDVIEDQQNTTNRIEKKIIDRLLKAGTRVTLPADTSFSVDQRDFEKWYVKNQAAKNMIGVYEFKGNLQFELAYLAQVYEEARQILGITDSFQGRRDPTATSGKAKEYAAAQAAGRQESQRVMKQAAYAQMFELMFKFQLAYADEPRPVIYKDHEGKAVYKEFNRYDFLKKDEDGQWYWNDQFLFSCDTSAPLASNREAMWQETRMNLQTGAFGDPKDTRTLILFWSKMEFLHYPGAGHTKKYLEERLKEEQEQARLMMNSQPPQGADSAAGMDAPMNPLSTAV